jgi:hypothetical protein
MSKPELITPDNYKKYIGKRVFIEIVCSKFGMMYPDENYLIGIKDGCWQFKSDEVDTEDQIWESPIEDDDCDTCLWDYDHYVDFYDHTT